MTRWFTSLLTYKGVPLWRDSRVLTAVAQVASALIVTFLVVFFVTNLLSAAERRGFSLGFDFVSQEAGFPIGETVISYEESDTFLYAFWVGILNTLRVAVIGIVFATILGIIAGVARLSTNWLIRTVATVYIETFRNVPLLVQLFFWYFAVFQALPLVQEALQWPGPVYISNRGLFLTAPKPADGFSMWLLFVLAGLVGAWALSRWLSAREERSGETRHTFAFPFLAFVVMGVVGWFVVGGSPMAMDTPALGRFNFQGGLRVTPEFGALLVGLTIYTGTFIAEIVRAGIQSVSRGQTESAMALGLTSGQTLRLVVFPQAIRVIMPPLINQYLNLTKNSSLAIAIGFPDTFFVGRTMINTAGRAVPISAMIMASYGAMSLVWSIIGNAFNRRYRLTER